MCPLCGGSKSVNAKRCWECANKSRREKLTGIPHTDDRVEKNRQTSQRQAEEGRTFDLAGYMADKKPHNWLPPGTERVVKDGRVQVKCTDGVCRYRSRLVWERAHGPLETSDIIHHINGDPMDDRPENLTKLTRGEHAAIHAEQRKEAIWA